MYKPLFKVQISISLILVFGIMVLAGCKPESNNVLSMAGEEGLKSDGNGWSKAFLRKNLSDCIARTGNKMSASEAYSYCECMMDKVQEKYPDENDAVIKATKEELAAIEASCLADKNNSTAKQWSSEDRNEFLTSCSSKMDESLGRTRAKDYCECMLGKIMSESPDVNQSVNISKSLMNNWANGCLK